MKITILFPDRENPEWVLIPLVLNEETKVLVRDLFRSTDSQLMAFIKALFDEMT